MPMKPAVQLNLTKEQYRTLLEMTLLGNWMINSTREKTIKEYDDVEQLVFSFAKQAGLEDCIEYVEKLKAYFPTPDFEEEQAMPFKEEYDDYTFWEELIHRLAWRDMERKLGRPIPEGAATEEQLLANDAEVKRYQDEFNANGIENLVLVDAPSDPSRVH